MSRLNKCRNGGHSPKNWREKLDLKSVKFLSARVWSIRFARTSRGMFTFFCRDVDGGSAVGSSRSSYESSGGKQLPDTATTMSKTHLQNVRASKYVHRATADVHSRTKMFTSETAASFFGAAFMTGISGFRNDFRGTFSLGSNFYSVIRIETTAPVKRVVSRTTLVRRSTETGGQRRASFIESDGMALRARGVANRCRTQDFSWTCCCRGALIAS